MEITLKKLTLDNFMGIRHFVFEPNGQSVIIKGVNGAGKTTLFSAFLYLLFGKNADGKADFALKTLDAGQELHNLDHTVEGVFDIDAREITLKKVFKEKYTKKRGNAQAEFTGHVTEHFIDGVPITQREYQDRINHLIDEDIFKLLTDPTFFNSLHWQKRRQILLGVCGDISDKDVIASNEALSALPEILDSKSIEDRKKIIAGRRTEINRRLNEIPARIDELERGLVDVSGYDFTAIRTQIEQIDKQIQSMKDDTQLSNLRKQKAELEATLSELEAERDKAHRDVTKEKENRIEPLKDKVRAKRTELMDLDTQIVRKQADIEYNDMRMAQLREDYNRIAAEKADVTDTCPTCGQKLPKERVEAAIKRHNQRQADRLADINAEGKRLKGDNAQLNEQIEAIIKKDRYKIEEEIGSLDNEIEQLEKKEPPRISFDTGKIDKVKAEIQEIEKQITEKPPIDTESLEEKKGMLQAQIAELEAAKKTKARIEELGAEEKTLTAEFEKLEGDLSLIDRFIVAKVNLLEEKINSKFSMVTWKLFETQINQGIMECCTALVDGVPWDKGLNDGHKILAGLDIVSTLQKHYGIKAPCWLDHAEALSDDPSQMDCQMILLKVSEDRELTSANYQEGGFYE